MKKLKLGYFLAAGLMILILPLIAHAQEGEVKPEEEMKQLTAEFVSIEGDVAVKKAEEEIWRVASLDMVLEPGDRIMSWSKGSVIIRTANGNEIEVDLQTQFEIDEMGSVKEEKTSVFKLLMGKAWFTVEKAFSLKHKFAVKTPTAVAAVRGTKFYLQVDGDGTTLVKLREGRLRVSNPLGEVDLGEGQETLVEPGKPPIPPKKFKEWPQPPSEREVVEEKPKEVVKAPPKPRARLGRGDIGMETVAEKGFFRAGFYPEFHFGPWGLALDLKLYYCPDTDKMGIFLEKEKGKLDWDIFKLNRIPQLIRWVEFDTKPLGVRYGRLEDLTLGAGILVDSYSLADEDGIRLRSDLGKVGGKIFYPLNEVTNVWGTRIFFRPLGKLQIGGSLAKEREEVVIENQTQGPVTGMAGDAIYSLGPADIYLQAGTYPGEEEDNFAFSFGLKGGIGPLGYRAEYRSGNLVFGYFDSIYEAAREAGALTPVVIEDFSGYLLHGSISPFENFFLGITYEKYGEEEDKLAGEVSLILSEEVQGSVTCIKKGIGGEEDFDFNKNTAIRTRIKYPIVAGVLLVLERNEYYDEKGKKTVDTDVGIQILF